jgi:outer membrane protein OmpA-like peptidoglycan-associated protein
MDPEAPPSGAARESRWTLAVQVLGAGAGIAAWVIVVGGARMWARLMAIDAPASQTVTVLPKELLVAEGVRTLIVPLLLGGAIAILTYLSRRADADDERPSGLLGAPDDLARTADALRTAATEAEERAASADVSLRVASRWAADVAGAADRDTRAQRQQLRVRLSDAHSALRDAENRLRRVVALSYELSAALDAHDDKTPSASDALRQIGKNAGAFVQECEAARARLASMMDEVRADRAGAKLGGEINAVRSTLGKANVPSIAETLHNTLDPKHLKWVIAALKRLGPVEYLRWWIRRLSDGAGSAAAIAVVVLLLLVFAGIALVLVNAAKDWMLGTALACALLFGACMVAGVRDDRWHVGAFLVLIAALPAVALAGFLGALGWYTAYVILLTVVTTWLALGAMRRATGAAATAWILFAAIAFWSGALAFISERGANVTTMGTAVVFQKAPTSSVPGLYLGRTSKAVYLAGAESCDTAGCRTVVGIPHKQVTCVVFGPAADVHNADGGEVRRESDVLAVADIEDDALAGYTHQTDDECDGPESKKKNAPPSNTESQTSTVTSNRFNLLNGLRISIGRPGKSTPAPGPDVRVIGPFRIVLGGGSEPPAPSTARGGRVVLGNVVFKFKEAELTPMARANIAVAAREIEDAGAQRVFLAGHADEKGSEELNLQLSQQRIAAVQAALKPQLPHSVKLVPWPFGERTPLACNRRKDGSDDREGRALNRRVEIRTRRLMPWEARGCKP